MSDGILTQGKLFPIRDYDKHEVSNRYALDGTGLNGLFVQYVTGGQNVDTADGYSNQNVASDFTNTYSKIYLNNRRVKPAVAGATKWEVAGVTLNTVAITDENGNALRNMPHEMREERQFVLTGQTVPILKRGFVAIAISQVLGGTAPQAGFPFVATGVGQIAPLTPAQATGASFSNLVLGRFASNSGAFNGGYIELEVTL
jgi:hypothetical protein